MSNHMEKTNSILETVKKSLNKTDKIKNKNEKIKVGIDLGTSSIVLVVLNEENQPITYAYEETNVVKDGLVVDFSKAVEVVKKLKIQAEKCIGREIEYASGAIPPNTVGNNKHVVGHVIEAAEITLDGIFDEPTAAAKVLEISNGAVVDIGGGTTGISIFEDSQTTYTADEATGGHHMSLVLAGNYKVPLEEAEKIKREEKKYQTNFFILKPVIEKMAMLTLEFIEDYNKSVDSIYLVGGATILPQFEIIFEKTTGIKTIKPLYPQLVTPTGIAMLSRAF